MRAILLVSLLSFFCGAAGSQTVVAPSFEAVSIKPAPNFRQGSIRVGCTGGPGSTDPGLLSCSFVSLADIIFKAYGLQPYQFSPPDWMRSSRFDINAKIPPGTTDEQLMRMAQQLLAERFKVKLHHEQKEMLTYELAVGKSGAKLRESTNAAPSSPEAIGPGRTFSMGENGFPVFPAGHGGLLGLNGHFRWTAFNITMTEVVKMLVLQIGEPVVDTTGLTGKYDIDLYWVASVDGRGPGPAASDGILVNGADLNTGPILLRAIQEQLGLKLGAKKRLGDIVVVDHAEKVPAEN